MPWIIQLAGITYNQQRPVGHFSSMIRPALPGLPEAEIPRPYTDKNGKLKDEFWQKNKLLKEDIEPAWFETELAMKIFNQYLRKADRIVFHNARFDVARIANTFERMGIVSEEWKAIPKYCTMLTLEPILKLPSKFGRGYKWPSLDEAYRALVDEDGFEDAHDAMADVQACAKVLFAIEELGYELVRV
jgi:DNA polymerase III epsilon subunit-like protein